MQGGASSSDPPGGQNEPRLQLKHDDAPDACIHELRHGFRDARASVAHAQRYLQRVAEAPSHARQQRAAVQQQGRARFGPDLRVGLGRAARAPGQDHEVQQQPAQRTYARGPPINSKQHIYHKKDQP